MEQRIIFRMPIELVKRFDETIAAKIKTQGHDWPPTNRSTVVRRLIDKWCDANKPTAKPKQPTKATRKKRPTASRGKKRRK